MRVAARQPRRVPVLLLAADLCGLAPSVGAAAGHPTAAVEIFALGQRGQSDAELPQALGLGSVASHEFAFGLDHLQAERGLSLILDPIGNDGGGALRIAVEIATDRGWTLAGATLANATDSGWVTVHPGLLRVGRNVVRLRAISGTGETTTVRWGQIRALVAPFAVVWRIGTNDESSADLGPTERRDPFDPGSGLATAFPRTLDTMGWSTQQLVFRLTGAEAERAKVLALDLAPESDDAQVLLALERRDGAGWRRVLVVEVGDQRDNRLVVPVDHLREGVNLWRLVAFPAGSDRTTLVWDSLALLERRAPEPPVVELLSDVLDASLNYYLRPEPMHASGLPLTAYKVGLRARYGYSNPTEWGHALQAWIVAAERGRISATEAGARLRTALGTMQRLQADPEQFAHGLFYPFYKVTDGDGRDVPFPYHDADTRLPSGDCALLYASIVIAEGWARSHGLGDVAALAAAVKGRIGFASCYYESTPGLAHLAHQKFADTGQLSTDVWFKARWDNFADEGGMVAFVAYLAGSLTHEQYRKVLRGQLREPRSWRGITVREAGTFNEMFTWPQRALVGYPMLGSAKARAYGVGSFVPAVRAHLAFGRELGVDFPGFSSAMSQSAGGVPLVGWQDRFVPPNLLDVVPTQAPEHVAPHALFIPACALGALDEATLAELYEKWVLLRADRSGVWHPSYSQDPFGVEVVASPYLNQDYAGADSGRYVFEELSTAYTVLSIYEGLTPWTGQPSFHALAGRVPGFAEKVAETLADAYPEE